jgi:4-hydroxybenzoate polyprenyltransferase
MQLLGHFLRLLRWPNLLFIAITQILFHFCIVLPAANGQTTFFPLQLQQANFWMLCVASVFIAGAGYIINDYFDINIDQVNKPHKMVVDKIISRRAAILWHWVFSGIGLMLSAYLSYKLRNPIIILGNILCVMLLWVYSTTYKRRLLVGNVLISLMTAWVILVILVAASPGWFTGQISDTIVKASVARLSRIGILYAAFAFVLSLVREVIKDMEDMEGDRRENCKTLPIVYGINAAKVFAGTWLFILIVMLIITQVYVLLFEWWYSALYIVLLVVTPLAMLFKKLFKANNIKAFHIISSQLKWVMLTGILSMVFFLLYTR